jgi:D-alanyl-D-alanine carboxypeptidase
MNANFMIKLAMTTAAVVVPSIGYTSIGVSSTMKVTPETASAKKAAMWAKKADLAKSKGQMEKALMFSELAVEGDMNNLHYRGNLAQMYMSQGRFQSAERTWMDVMELGQVDARSIISLSLSRIAQGKVESAVALVDANRSLIPASDYALTLALAGKSGQAVEILTDAIRSDNASSRTRQNLALAYALEGRWREARVMASQDMPQDRVNERIAEWAQYARPGSYQMRVAGLLKVTPKDDAGQPVRLALNSTENRMAAVDDTSVLTVPYSPAPTGQLNAIGPAPVADSNGFDAANEAVPEMAAPVAPPVEPAVQVAMSEPVNVPAQNLEGNVVGVMSNGIQMVSIPVLADYSLSEAPLIKASKSPAKLASKTGKPVKLALADVAPKAGRLAGGSHVVQLGAYGSAAQAKSAWDYLRNKHTFLTGFSSASSTVVVNGKTFVRLAASGFDSAASAANMCNKIKLAGGSCIVRSIPSKQPVGLASVAGRKVAVK